MGIKPTIVGKWDVARDFGRVAPDNIDRGPGRK